MKCYHMTSLDRLESINRIGLVPRNEKNSKLVNDNKVKVFFSEGLEGAIALYVDFDIIYNKIKNKEEVLEDVTLNNEVLSSSSLEDYLKDGVYLSFEMKNTTNERNFENGCTSEIIKPNGAIYPNSPDFDVATKKIQNKVKMYYAEHFNEINYYKVNDYEMVEFPLDIFLSKEEL